MWRSWSRSRCESAEGACPERVVSGRHPFGCTTVAYRDCQDRQTGAEFTGIISARSFGDQDCATGLQGLHSVLSMFPPYSLMPCVLARYPHQPIS
jgi:hypothetical protein